MQVVTSIQPKGGSDRTVGSYGRSSRFAGDSGTTWIAFVLFDGDTPVDVAREIEPPPVRD